MLCNIPVISDAAISTSKDRSAHYSGKHAASYRVAFMHTCSYMMLLQHTDV